MRAILNYFCVFLIFAMPGISLECQESRLHFWNDDQLPESYECGQPGSCDLGFVECVGDACVSDFCMEKWSMGSACYDMSNIVCPISGDIAINPAGMPANLSVENEVAQECWQDGECPEGYECVVNSCCFYAEQEVSMSVCLPRCGGE